MSDRIAGILRHVGVVFVSDKEVSRVGALAHIAVVGDFRELDQEELPEFVTIHCRALVDRAELEIVTLHEDSTVCKTCALAVPEEHRAVLPPIYQNPGFIRQLMSADIVDRDRHGERVLFQRCDGGSCGY